MLRSLIFKIVKASALGALGYRIYKFGRSEEQNVYADPEVAPLEYVTPRYFFGAMAYEVFIWFLDLPEKVRESVRSAGKSILEMFDVSRDTVLDDGSNDPYMELRS